MKKSLIVFLLLVFCAAALFSVSAVKINYTEDKITVQATTLSGDPQAAAGIEITERTSFRSHMLWETRLSADDPADSKTDFSFHPSGLNLPNKPRASLDFLFSLNGGISSSGNILSDTQYDDYGGFPMLPAAELAEETAPGETKKASFRLADYYEYLPYSFENVFNGSHTTVYTGDLQQQIRDYFRFRTPEDLVVKIELTKDSAGQVVTINFSCSDDNAGLQTLCAATDDGFYFTFSLSGSPGFAKNFAFDEIPGGFGIYHLPYTLSEGDRSNTCTLLGDQLETVYQLDPGHCQVLDLQSLPGNRALSLFTLEDGRCWLNIISLENYELIQRLEISGNFESGFYYPPRIEEGFLLVCDPQNHFTLLEQQTDGSFHPVFTGDLALPIPEKDAQTLLLFNFDSSLAYDGSRLAIATLSDPYRSANFCLLIFDNTGLVYAGYYQHSQDQLAAELPSNDRCIPISQDALLLSFEE